MNCRNLIEADIKGRLNGAYFSYKGVAVDIHLTGIESNFGMDVTFKWVAIKQTHSTKEETKFKIFRYNGIDELVIESQELQFL